MHYYNICDQIIARLEICPNTPKNERVLVCDICTYFKSIHQKYFPC